MQTFSSDHLGTAVEAAHRALAEHFERHKISVNIGTGAKPYINRLIHPLPDPPPVVSLIVPTRDRLPLLRNCLDGLLHRTKYPRLEIIVVNNESIDPVTLDYFDRLREEEHVRLLSLPGPFNFSALNNRAVMEARGELIGFINNDIEVIHEGWLEEMVSRVMQPGVGAVGAKLYYADDTIQHAGVVLGLGGVAGHSHKCFPRSDFGYMCVPHVVRNVSGVTAACMIMHKKIFDEIGGFDEANLPVAFNDVDLCLKIREAGYNIIWTPYAELYHLESASRGSDALAENIERAVFEQVYMKDRWREKLEEDPFYSPNLTTDYENYSLAFPPRVHKRWIQDSVDVPDSAREVQSVDNTTAQLSN
jgi:GT2 family glycosyltransferase